MSLSAGQSRGAAFSDDNQPSRMQIRNTVNRANNYNLTAHVGSAGAVAILTELHLAHASKSSYREKTLDFFQQDLSPQRTVIV